MCYSPEADFTAAAVVGAIGVATLSRVRTRRELIVGTLPILFAAHQFVEGFVWLGLQGKVSRSLGDTGRDIYVIYAYTVLPIIVPIGFALLEPDATRRRWLRPLVGLGLLVGLDLLWQLTHFPISAQALPECVTYRTHTPHEALIVTGYVIATCGPALLSSRTYLRWFGVVNVLALAGAAAIYSADIASIWCFYAACASLLVLEHFRRARRAEARRDRTPDSGRSQAVLPG